MCVICYELSADEHWSDTVDDDDQNSAARARHRRLRSLQTSLAPLGLKVSDPGVGRHLVISSLKGASQVASGLPAVWLAAQHLSGRPVDVLDPDLISAHETARRSRKHP